VTDWFGLIVSFILGVLTTLAFWLIDRKRAKRQRVRETRDSWKGLAKEIELLLWRKETTSVTIYEAHVRHPIDTWRSILGPGDFQALEAVESAYQWVEHCFRTQRDSPSVEAAAALVAALNRRSEAVTTFANLSRLMQSADYTEVVTREQRRDVRRSFARHPITTWKRERHNRRVRRQQDVEYGANS
jgi:hypothetical protein